MKFTILNMVILSIVNTLYWKYYNIYIAASTETIYYYYHTIMFSTHVITEPSVPVSMIVPILVISNVLTSAKI